MFHHMKMKYFKEYKRLEKQGNNMEDEFYPENISDVSVSAILALTVFMDSLNDMNIKNIKSCTISSY